MSATAQRLPEPTAGPDLEFNFISEIEKLRSEPAYNAGRNAKTLIKHPDFRVVLTAIRADSRVAAHQAAGRVSVQCLGQDGGFAGRIAGRPRPCLTP